MVSSAFRSRGLNGIPEVRTFFRTNEQPIFFVGPTAFNLLGIDRWVRGFEYIVYHDSWDSLHPRVFTPKIKPYNEFSSSEQINNYLLRDPEVQRHIELHCAATGLRPMIAMAFFDGETEQICRELDYNLILPQDARMHGNILAMTMGTPAAAISYMPKTAGVLRAMDLADWYLDIECLGDGALTDLAEWQWLASSELDTTARRRALEQAAGVVSAGIAARQLLSRG